METRVFEVDPLEDCRKIYKEAAAVLADLAKLVRFQLADITTGLIHN